MEIGQIIHNNPVCMKASDFAYALVSSIRDELTRVYWNVNQKPWAGSPENYDWYTEKREYDPLPPGIEWRPYYNWGGCPKDPDWDQEEANKPNFSFEGIQFRWYKRFGRSLNVNVCWSAGKWERWFERIMQTISAYETQSCPHLRCGGNKIPYPDPAGAVPIDRSPEDLRYIELTTQVSTLEAQLNMIACVCIDVSEGKKPKIKPNDWRWCKELKYVNKLGLHALTAPGKFKLHEKG